MSRKARPLGAAVLLAGFAGLLTACSSGPAVSAGSTTARSGTSAPTTSGPATSSTTTTVPFNEATNARQDVTTGTCRVDAAGAWSWSGTVTNRTSLAHTYRIIVDFTDAAATVLQTKTVTVPALAPGRTAHWTTSGAAGKKSVLCVVRSARIA